MHIISVFTCAYYLIQERKFKTNVKWLFFIVILFICGTVNISINMRFNELAWIDLRGYPGGPLMFLLQEQAHPIQTCGNAFSIIIGFLTDALLVSLSLLSWIIGV